MSLRKTAIRSLLRGYERRKRRLSDTSLEHCLEVARRTVRDTKHVFLITDGASGWPSARLVEPIAEQDLGTFWIGTDPNLLFPDGPLSDGYVLIRVEAEQTELLSFAGNVVPEPFGLRPVRLERAGETWRLPVAPD